MSKPTLYLMLGYPGAGKTTVARMIQDLTGAVLLSSDVTRRKLFALPSFTEHEHNQLYGHLDRELEAVMQEGQDVIYDANLNRFRHRQEKYDIAARHNYQVKLLWIQTPHELAKTRRLSDTSQHDLVPAHENPGSMFERIVRLFEPPKPDEACINIDGTNVTEATIKQLLN